MNYLYGWNSVAEFVFDELGTSGVQIAGVLIDDMYIENVTCPDYVTVFGASSVSFNTNDSVINCLGYKDLYQRIRVGERLLKLGVLKSFIPKRAQIHPSVFIGLGSVLVGDVVIERGCDIGKHCLFWGGSRICHDSTLGEGVFLASGSIIGGRCSIGQSCSVGFNSSIREESVMPDGTKVGANHFWRP